VLGSVTSPMRQPGPAIPIGVQVLHPDDAELG